MKKSDNYLDKYRPPEVTSYSYQVGGNLDQITLPDSSTIQYQYDAYGNRIQKETSTELIAYHYSGASLQQEVHKDPSTLTILYTLIYVPWGFVKTVGQTSTSYYYLYDQRGNTRGITDAQGTILETYHYSPYGILLSTPSISQPHFLSGNAQCQYEAESSLYYMHARYYDAHTGRFLTKDALPGSMSSPLSQNRYTYCQNDPITLIDPTGNSPENTGNPPRMSGPQSSQQVSIDTSNPCYLPDVGNGDSIPMIDISGNNDTCLANLNLHTDDGKTCYIIVILPNKAPVKVFLGTVSKGSDGSFTLGRWYAIGEIKVVGPYGPLIQETSDFIDGINEAIKFMGNSINGLLSGRDVFEAINYMNQYLTEYQWNIFSRVTSNYDVKDQRMQFMKHAIIGGYIASKMRNFSDATGTEYADEGRMNFEIGFWVSFYAERASLKYADGNKEKAYLIPLFTKGIIPGLIEIANLVKILAVAEQGDSSGDPDAFLVANVMNVERTTKDGMIAAGKTPGNGQWLVDSSRNMHSLTFDGLDDIQNGYEPDKRFVNIALGVGYLFKIMQLADCTDDKLAFGEPISLENWLRGLRRYNGNTKEKGSQTYKHSVKIMNLFRLLYGEDAARWEDELNAFQVYIDGLANQ
jgi:RHS repeat-associated protein